MKVLVDRAAQIIYLTNPTAKEACQIGLYFGLLCPDLAGRAGAGWYIRAEAPPHGRVVEEYTGLDPFNSSCILRGYIDNSPPNHCDTCTCPPKSVAHNSMCVGGCMGHCGCKCHESECCN